MESDTEAINPDFVFQQLLDPHGWRRRVGWDPVQNRLRKEVEGSEQTLMDLLDVSGRAGVDWGAVQSRLRSHPHEASRRCHSGYPLHKALFRDPHSSVVCAFLDAHSNAASARDANGNTPLALACRSCGADVVRVLLEAFPEAAEMKNRSGRIPLHETSSEADIEVVRLLLRANPEGVCTRDGRDGWLPLHRAAWSANATMEIVQLLLDEGVRWGVEGGSGGASVEDRWGTTPLEIACGIIDSDGTSDESSLAWEKVVALARAATSTSGTTDDGSVDVTPLSDRVMLPTLHAVVKAGCPEPIIRHTIFMGSPGVALARDHRGRTPLAVAASLSEPDLAVVETLLCGCSGGEASRMADINGRLPLHLAAESGWVYEKALETLLDAEPRVLATRDVITHLYPFMLAAAGPRSNVDSAFNILRADPSLVQKGMGVLGMERQED